MALGFVFLTMDTYIIAPYIGLHVLTQEQRLNCVDVFISMRTASAAAGLTSRILTCTELKGHCFVLVSGYVC